MVDLFTKFCDILVYPMYHISDDSLLGILFYLLLLFFAFHLLLSCVSALFRPKKVVKL